MRRLILLRHAKSDWDMPGKRDHDRALAARGREAAAKIGTYMSRHALRPDLVLCSTAMRTRQTWELISAEYADEIPVEYDDRLYEVDADTILDAVKRIAADIHVLMLIGHNPGIRDLAELSIASGDVEARQRLIEKFPTAGLAIIDFQVDNWRKLHTRSGRLDRFVVPRMLDLATD